MSGIQGVKQPDQGSYTRTRRVIIFDDCPYVQHIIFLNFCIAVVLWSGCFGEWFRYLTHYKVDPRLWTDCKLFYFMFYYGRHYSSMLLLLMSLEKCFAVYFPLKAKTICTTRTARWVTGIVGIILAGYDFIYLVDMNSVTITSGRRICRIKGSQDYKVILYAIDSVLYSFGPFTLMLITNFAIVFKFMKAKCNENNSSESTSQALVKSATRGTAMVVTVSVAFLLLTSPSAVNLRRSNNTQLIKNPLYRAFMNLTQYLNHSINGVLYIIVGSRFRKELLKIFSCKERPECLSRSHSVKNISLDNVSGN